MKKPTIIQPYGNVGVDSGQLLIIDPCYLEEFMKMYSYEDICNTEDLTDEFEDDIMEREGEE
jgi:hypothetical protein